MKEFTDDYGRTYEVEKITAISTYDETRTRQDTVLVTTEQNGEKFEYVVFGWDYENLNTIDDFNEMCEDSYAWESDWETLETIYKKGGELYLKVGNLYDNPSYDIISNGEEFYVLNKKEWNGEYYSNCWKTDNKKGIRNLENEKNFEPIYQERKEDIFELIGYKEW